MAVGHARIYVTGRISALILLHLLLVMVPAVGVVEVLPSLLAWDATRYGLPAFQDLVASVIPLDPPFNIKGKVVKGFGRGSKVSI